MKPIKIFLSLIIFAICTAFNVPAQSMLKPILVPIKAGTISRVAVVKAAVSNFHRCDSLVMYESITLGGADLFA